MQMILFMNFLSHFFRDTFFRDSHFFFRKHQIHTVQLLYYKYHKINFKRVGSYIDSSDWIRKKRVTINPKKIIIVFNMLQQLH